MDLTQTQIDSQQHGEYSLTCAKCRHDGGIGIIYDGVWFFDSKDAISNNAATESSLFCCTSCISWFRRHSRDWFQDDVPRQWFRFTKSEMKNWSRESWAGSEEKSISFVENITRKQQDKKSQKAAKKASRGSDSASAIASGPPASTTTAKRKRRRANVDVDVAPVDSVSNTSSANFVVERYNPKSTFDSFQQGIKTIYAFLNMCNSAEPTSSHYTPNSVHEILTMQIRLLEGLMQTLQEHISFDTT